MQTISSVPRVALEKAMRPETPGAAGVPAFKALLGARTTGSAAIEKAIPTQRTDAVSKTSPKLDPPAALPFAAVPVPPVSGTLRVAEGPLPLSAAALEVVAVERAMDVAGRFGPVQCIRLELGGGTVTIHSSNGGTGVAVEVTTDPRIGHETRRAIIDAVRRRAPGASVSERRRGAK